TDVTGGPALSLRVLWRQRDLDGLAVDRGGAEAEGLVGRLARPEVDGELRLAVHAGVAGPGHRHRDLSAPLQRQATAADRPEGEELDRLAVEGEAPVPDGEGAADGAVVEHGRRLRWRPAH